MTFDIGHNHGCDNLDEPYIIEHQAHLFHMHMHDALGKKNHLALGTGELDICKYLPYFAILLSNKSLAGRLKFVLTDMAQISIVEEYPSAGMSKFQILLPAVIMITRSPDKGRRKPAHGKQ